MSELRVDKVIDSPTSCLQKRSRYYLDPSQGNGPTKIIRPADPEKLAKVREMKAKKIGKKNPFFEFNNRLTKSQLRAMKGSII